jgi:predicted ATPase
MANYRATGAELGVPFMLALIAEAYDIAGQSGENLTLLDDALHIIDRTEERWFAAELNRLKGQLLLRQGYSKPAREAVSQSPAHRPGAEGQALENWRAPASLARLRRDQGRQAEARDLLAPVYGWFTEGFGTSDLKEAKALLDELGNV